MTYYRDIKSVRYDTQDAQVLKGIESRKQSPRKEKKKEKHRLNVTVAVKTPARSPPLPSYNLSLDAFLSLFSHRFRDMFLSFSSAWLRTHYVLQS